MPDMTPRSVLNLGLVLALCTACQVRPPPVAASRTASEPAPVVADVPPVDRPRPAESLASLREARLPSPRGEILVTPGAISVGGRVLLQAPGGAATPPPVLVAAAPGRTLPALVLVQFPGGAACPAQYRLIDIVANPARISPPFGSCSDQAMMQFAPGRAMVSMPERGRVDRDLVWVYEVGTAGAPGRLRGPGR